MKLSDFITSESVPKGEIRAVDLSRVRVKKESEIIGMTQEIEGDKLKITVTMSQPEFIVLPKRANG